MICRQPWIGYNLSRFEDPTLISTNDGLALSGSNCDPVYHGAGTGLTSFDPASTCVLEPPPPGDQSEVATAYRTRAREYVEDHLGRAPIVALARVGRTWSVFRPSDMIEYNVGEGRERWVTRLGLVVYYPTVVAAVAGAILLWRRPARWYCAMLLVPAVTVTVGSALTYGQTRFRAAAEPSLAVFAAIAIVAAIAALRTRPAAAVSAATRP